MRDHSRSALAARHAATLFAVTGLLALALIVVPGRAETAPLATVAVLTLIVAAAVRWLPWRRWSLGATLALVVPAFGLISVASIAEVLPVRTYGVFFILVFAWVGAHHPPWTSLVVLPVAVPCYVVPLVAVDVDPPFDARALVLVMVVGVLVAETIARGNLAAQRARTRAESAAEAFRVVGETNGRVRRLDPEAVLAAVVDGAMALGYDAANLAVLQPDAGTFRAVHARGLAVTYATGVYPLRAGLTGQVVDTGDVVVVDDYQATQRSIAEIRKSGLRTCVGVPVVSDDDLAAVLLVGFADRRTVFPEMIEALKLLASAAGAALANVRQYEAERQAAVTNLVAATTDVLTGIGNRRAANARLDRLRPGDSVAMVDLDRFKAVNDRGGHAAGDQVLIALASHLAKGLRRLEEAVVHVAADMDVDVLRDSG